MLSELSLRARALSAALEPVIGSAHFAPEVHAALAELGFAPSPGIMADEWNLAYYGPCAMPDYMAYICARSATLGTAPGEVVAAAFGVFQTDLIVSMITSGQGIATAEQLRLARQTGAAAQLARILGERPDRVDQAINLLETAGRNLPVGGRPLFAGALAVAVPADPLGAVWRLGERVREFRGDSFTIAWAAAGFDGCQIQLLTEMIAGYPGRIYTSGRGWNDTEMNAAEVRLTERGYLLDGSVTDAGRAAREAVELCTDLQSETMFAQLGEDAIELIAILREWGGKIIAANGHAPGMPQTQIMDRQVQEWMDAHELETFGAGPAL